MFCVAAARPQQTHFPHRISKAFFCLLVTGVGLLFEETHLFFVDCPQSSIRRLGFLCRGSLRRLLCRALTGTACQALRPAGAELSLSQGLLVGRCGLPVLPASRPLLRPLFPPTCPRSGAVRCGFIPRPRALSLPFYSPHLCLSSLGLLLALGARSVPGAAVIFLLCPSAAFRPWGCREGRLGGGRAAPAGRRPRRLSRCRGGVGAALPALQLRGGGTGRDGAVGGVWGFAAPGGGGSSCVAPGRGGRAGGRAALAPAAPRVRCASGGEDRVRLTGG